jgi:two-component system, NarL family, invasion response regulator UvrY
MTKVLITDDHPVVRRGIRQILEEDESIKLVDEARDGSELIEKLIKHEYDVVLLDISLPGRSGLDLIGQIKKIKQKTAVLIMSIYSEEMYAIQSLRNGASGYLTKMSAPEELLTAIHKVSSGERYITSTLAEKLASELLNGAKKPLNELLSARELEVLKLFAAGNTVVQIASELSLSPKTISTYRSRLLEKLHLKTTSDLIRYSILEDIKGEE